MNVFVHKNNGDILYIYSILCYSISTLNYRYYSGIVLYIEVLRLNNKQLDLTNGYSSRYPLGLWLDCYMMIDLCTTLL